MLTVHHMNSSHSHVVLWLLEELGVPFELILHQREASGRSPDSLRAIHPAGKSPTIVDQGQAMIESTAIILHSLETYGNGRLRPAAGTREAMTFLQWLCYLEGSAKGALMQSMQVKRLPGGDPIRAMAEAVAPPVLSQLEQALEGQTTIVPGQLTAADLQLGFFEEILEASGQMPDYPNMERHLASMRSRPAYQKAVDKGGPVGLKALFKSLQL